MGKPWAAWEPFYQRLRQRPPHFSSCAGQVFPGLRPIIKMLEIGCFCRIFFIRKWSSMFDSKRHLLDALLWAGTAFTHPPAKDKIEFVEQGHQSNICIGQNWGSNWSHNSAKRDNSIQFWVQLQKDFLFNISPAQHSPYVHDDDNRQHLWTKWTYPQRLLLKFSK